MNCLSCEGKNRDDARFCKHCGADLFSRCRMCGALLDDDARFCDACGTPVSEIAAAPASSTAARKVVTVLFGDLTGSTALEERMDAESVRSILDRFYSAMRTEIERHSGRVVKFVGDGVMAAFGVPEVSEDDAARAVDAAIAMREELEQLASDLQLGLSLKIGINTGEVVVSEVDDDVVGDAVNVASRLEGAATAGEILVGEDTWRLTRGTSRYEPVEPLTLKGKSEPVPAYKLLSVDERTADSAAAPFVGRETELGRLMAAFQDAVDSNAARLVTIIGSPGLGKTRLARELMNELADVARVRETRCDPAGSSTFAPIAEALRAGIGFTETDSEGDVLAALADRFPADDPDRERVAKLIGPLFGIGVPGSTEETFWALRRVIEAAAHQQPVVFVLDDIHWAEPLLLDLIEHLHQWIRDAPVLLVGTARPELRDLRPSLTEGGQATVVIALEGLDRDATAKLALNLLGAEELPSELLAKIPASTEGNPLFVRELVRMLVDDGVLLRTADGWSVTVDVDAIEVPPTITSLLSARVERLRNDERAVVELASVIGKEFYRGALYDLAPTGVKDQVDGCLESLRRKELVEPVGTYWIDEPVYRFHHVLIRDAAYRRLLKESRADVHERVAEWLARKTEDVLGEHEELLGYHLEQAHEYKQQLGRSDDELGRRAAELLQTAAQRALDRDDLPAAAALSGRALDRLPDGDACRPELLLIRCEALLSMGDVTRGAPVVAEFERLASTPRLQAWATCFNGHLATLTAPERLQETQSSVAGAALELTELGDQAGAAKAHTVHASALAGLGRFGECEAVLDHALTAARAANDRRRITATLGSAPHAALWGPNPVSRAGGRCLDIVRLLRITTGSPAVEAASLRCQAVLEAFRGRSDAARRMLRSARRTLEELGLQHELLETEQFAGIVELVAGDAAAAGSHLRTAHDGFRAVGVDVLAAQSAALLARAHLMLGEDAEAEAFIGTSEQAGAQDLKTAIAWRSFKAEILARRGEFDEARRLAQEAVDLAERTDALIDHGNACRSLGRVLRAAGDAAGAKGAEDRALALYERKGATALMTAGASEAQALQQPPPVSTSSLRNRCTTVVDQAVDLIKRNEWDAIRSGLSEDVTNADNRPGFRTSTLGRDALMEQMRVIADLGFSLAGAEFAAVRGERLCLFRAIWREPSGLVVEVIYVAEINSDGAVVALCAFDPSDLDAAFAELDDRFMLGEARGFEHQIRGVIGFMDRMNDRRWDDFRSMCTADAVVVDRTPAGRGEMVLERFIASIDELVALTSDLRVRVTAVHGMADGVTWFEAHNRGVSVEGAEVDLAYQTLLVHRGNQIARVEMFPAEHLDRATTRFGELAVAPGGFETTPRGGGELDHNRCARLLDEGMRRYESMSPDELPAFLRWLGSGHAEGATQEDRRAGLGSLSVGRAQIVERFASLPVIPSQVRRSLLATRGERLALMQIAVVGADDGFENEMLWLAELDADDLFSAEVLFDQDAVDAAIAELDERYVRGEGAVDPDTVRLIGAFARSYGVEDVDLLRSHCTEDFVVVDNRPASGATNDLDGFVHWVEAAWELTSERTAYVASFEALTAGMALVRFEVHWTTREGAAYETVLFIVFIRRGDRMAYAEQFLLEQIDQARARFAELASADGRAQTLRPLDTAATRWYASLAECFNRTEWEAAAQLFDPGFVRYDKRSGLRSQGDLRDFFLSANELAELGIARLTATPIAVRGERLALFRALWSGDGNDITALVVIELNEDGRAISAANFDPDDLYGALSDLEDRYVREKGASIAEAVRLAHRFTMTAGSRNDWPALREIISDDFVLVDHRPGYWTEPRGVDDFRAYVDSAFDDSWSRWSWVSQYLHLSPRISLGELRVAWTTADGQELDTSRLGLFVIHDGLIVRGEYFPLDALAEALARCDELGASASQTLDNRSMAVVERVIAHVMADEWDAYSRFHTDDSTIEDRRRGLRASFSGLAEILEFAKGQRDAFNVRDYDCVATRGERLALARGMWRTKDPEGGFDAEVLRLTEIDDEDHIVAAIFFEPDDLDAAIAELDERYIAGEAGGAADVWRLAVSFTEAMNVLDEEKIRDLLSADFTLVDHRPASWGSVHGVEEFLQTQRTWHELWPVRHIVQRRDLAISADAAVGELSIIGRSDLGGEVDTSRVVLINVRDGVLHRMEFFPLDQVDEALAAFGARTRPHVVDLENAATHFVRRLQDTMNRGTLQEFVDLHAPSFTLDDRRAGLRHVTRGLDQIRAYWIAAMERGLDRVARNEAVAVRGDLLALSRRIYTSARDGGAFESEQLVIDEVDASGRVVHAVFFDPDDLDAALDELDERFIAGEGSEAEALVRAKTSIRHAWNNGPWTSDALAVAVDDDLQVVDHRHVSGGRMSGRDAWVQFTSELRDVAQLRMSHPVFLALAPNLACGRVRLVGTNSEGGTIDVDHLSIWRCTDGIRIDRLEPFALDDVDRALARFEELRVEGAGPPPDASRLDNACIRRVHEVWLRYERGDWDGLLELYTPDHVTEDLRVGLRATYTGPGAEIENLKASRSIGARLAAMMPVAVRGERLALVRMDVTGPPDESAFDTAALVLSEIARDGRKLYDAVYDPSDLDAAFAELDRRYLAGEGAPFAGVLKPGLGLAADRNRRDWQGFASHFAENTVFVDRRPASLPEISGRDGIVRWGQTLVTPDTRHDIVAVRAICENCGVFEFVSRGTNSEGGEVESAYLHVTVVRDGLITRTERFALSDAAYARYEELRSPGDHTGGAESARLENQSVLINQRVCDAFGRRAWDFFQAYFPDDHEFEDRRPGMQTSFRGRELAVENLRQAAANGAQRLAYAPIAIRGQNLALGTWRWDASDWDVEVLVLDEHNAQGQAVRAVVFEPTDVDAAFDELEGRYLAGEGAPFVGICRLLLDQRRAYNARDWDAYRSRCHPEMTFVDHRPAGAGTFVGPDTQITYLTALIDLAPDAQLWTTDVVAIDVNRVLARHAVRGSSSEGADIELAFLVLYVMADGRLSRQEVFPLDQRDAAIARFHELGPRTDVDTPRLENEATRLRDAWLRIWNAGLWDPDTDPISPDMLNDDRRTGLSNVFVGRDEHIAQLEIIREMGAALRGDVIAIRGQRLALHENEWYDPAGRFASTVAGLQLLEYDDAGRLAAAIQFDREDLSAALIELDERFIAGEGAAGAEFVRLQQDVMKAVNAGDWDAYRARLADDVTVIDHRPASMGEIHDADEFVRSNRALYDVMGSFRIRFADVLRANGSIGLSRLVVEGRNDEGGEVDLDVLVLVKLDDGLVKHFEYFPPHQVDDALERYQELEHQPPPRRLPQRPLENEAVRTMRSSFDAFARRDWGFFATLVAADFELDDRRLGFGNVVRGPDAVIENLRQTVEIGVREIGYEPLAIRGERLQVGRTWWTAEGWELETVSLSELDRDGYGVRTIIFDATDLDVALDELDELYIAGEGGAGAEFVRRQRATVKAMSAGDWDAYRSLIADGIVVIDHRPASGGLRDAEGFVRGNQALYEVMGGCHVRTVEILRAHDAIGASRLVIEGSNSEGGVVEINLVAVARFVDGLLEHFEEFPTDSADDALARYEELRRRAHHLENACARHWARFSDSWNSGRWDGRGDEVSAEIVIDDRRSGLGSVIRGRDGYLAQMQVLRQMGPAVRTDVVAIRGERMALQSLEWYDAKGRTGAMVRSLHLHELDDDDRLVRIVVFDPDELEAAFAEMDERFLASDEATEHHRRQADFVSAHNARDWDRFRAIFTEDHVLEDHRPSSFGDLVGPDAFMDIAKSAIEMVPDRRFTVLTTQTDRSPSLLRAEGTDIYGNSVVWDFLTIFVDRAGKLCRSVVMAPDATDEAVARTRELASRPAVDGLQNRALDALRRFAETFERQDWGGLEQLLAPELIRVDHRRGISGTGDREEFIEGCKVLAGLGYGSVRFGSVATRGDRLCLGRAVAGGSHDYESDAFVLVETTEDGRVSYLAWFDLDDLDTAFDELDERFMSGEGAPHADVIRLHRALRRAVNERRFDDFRDLLAKDLVFIDHRPASLGATTGERWTEAVRAIVELIPDVRVGFVSYSALDVDKWWASATMEGTSTEGAQVDLNTQTVGRVENGRINRFEFFPDDATQEASAAFEALSNDRGDEPGRDILENAATRAVRRLMDVREPSDLLSSDEMFVTDILVEDRRPLFQASGTGVAAVAGAFAAFMSLGMRPVDADVVAVRGERLALCLGRLADDDDNIIETLCLYEAVPDGRLSHIVFLESDDLATALDELDERYRSGEGAPYADMLERSAAQREALRLGDWDTYRMFFAEDVVLIDHRPVSLGEVRGRDEVVRGVQALAPLVQGVRADVRAVYAIDQDRMLLQASTSGVSEHGAEFEISHIRLQQWRDGQVVRIEMFPVDEFDAARTRFDELASASLVNDATRAARMISRAFARRDWDAFAAGWSDDVVRDDRRKAAGGLAGKDGLIESANVLAELGFERIELRTIAVRGDHLSLEHGCWSGEHEFRNELLAVYETGEDGRVVHIVYLEPDDLEAALEELDDWYAAGEGAGSIAHLEAGRRVAHAFKVKDWEEYKRWHTDDFVFVDHRPASLGEMDLDELIEATRTMTDLLADVRPYTSEVIALGPNVSLSRNVITGQTVDGAALDFSVLILGTSRGGRMSRVEYFREEDFDAALAGFERLSLQT